MVPFNPACYLPTAASKLIPSSLSCPPPPSVFTSTYEAITSPFGSTFTALRAGMDALLSLPLLSFLLIPTMTSYSTSLNLLFFYLTWSTLVLSHPPLRVEIVASLAVNILFYIIPSTFFFLCDLLFPSVSKSFKSLGSTALPFQNLSRRDTPRHLKILGWSLANILLAVGLQAAIEYSLVTWAGRKSALKITTTLPLPWAILKDLLRGFLLRDLLTFLIHRHVLHNHRANALTRDLTILHTTWYHGQVHAPFPLSASYDHPLTYVLRVFLPTYLPAYIWRFHLLTYILFLTLISLETTFTHSGYSSIPTNFVLGGIARRNDMHCLTNGHGNFGTWGVFDWIVGTNVGGDLAEELMAEIEEAELKTKVNKRAVRGAKKVRAINQDLGGLVSDDDFDRVGKLLDNARDVVGLGNSDHVRTKSRGNGLKAKVIAATSGTRRTPGRSSGASGSDEAHASAGRSTSTSGGRTRRRSTRKVYVEDDVDDSDYQE